MEPPFIGRASKPWRDTQNTGSAGCTVSMEKLDAICRRSEQRSWTQFWQTNSKSWWKIKSRLSDLWWTAFPAFSRSVITPDKSSSWTHRSANWRKKRINCWSLVSPTQSQFRNSKSETTASMSRLRICRSRWFLYKSWRKMVQLRVLTCPQSKKRFGMSFPFRIPSRRRLLRRSSTM